MSTKLIFDNIHKYIKISPIAKQIIDTVEFKRLKNISQLGTCHYVFPCGNHSRFEHSIGVYHLTGKMLENIKKSNDNIKVDIEGIEETELTDRIVELVKLGGLCHDLGHGPYSHVFDDIILADIEHENSEHEVRSCKLFEKIVIKINKCNADMMTPQEIQFVKDIIYPKKHHTNFIYQIVSNNLNSIDVDKFDYIARDTYCLGLEYGFDYSRLLEDVKLIDNKICYPKQTYMHMYNLFMTRYCLHKQIYNHKAVKSIEYMIYDIMNLLNPILGIKESIEDLDKFCIFTDQYMFDFLDLVCGGHSDLLQINIDPKYKNNIAKAANILQRIRERKLYKFVGEYVSDIPVNLNINHFQELNKEISEEDIIISCVKMGYISGNKKNPLDNIYFYDKKRDTECFMMDKKDVSNFIPDSYQEYCVKVFCKNMEKYDMIKKIINNIFDNIPVPE